VPQVIRGGPLQIIDRRDYPIEAPIHLAMSGSEPSV